MGFNKVHVKVLVDAPAVEFSRVHAKVFNKDVKDFKVAQAVEFSKVHVWELHVQVKAVVKMPCVSGQGRNLSQGLGQVGLERQGLTGCQGPNVGGVTPQMNECRKS